MPRYSDESKDELIYYLDEFLKDHKPSELVQLVADAIYDNELEERKEDETN